MTIPVLVQQFNGEFRASVLGSSSVQVVRPSRDEAINAIQQELATKMASGEIVDVEVPPLGLTSLAGRFRDDPTLQDICDEIYRERDADRPQ